MKKFKFGKLVRDKIVDAIIQAGNKPIHRRLGREEYVKELKKKLKEEVGEFCDEDKINLSELADVEELIQSLLIEGGFSKEDLDKERMKKNASNGKFNKKLYVDFVEAKDDSEWVGYYLARPKQYPEIDK